MSLESIILIIVAGLNFGLALMVWLINPKNKINICFGLSALFFGFWSLFEGLFREASTRDLAFLFAKAENSSGALIVVFFLLFVFYFPYQQKRFNYLHFSLIFISTLLMEVIIWFTNLQVEEVILLPHNNDFVLGIIGRTYFVIFMSLYVLVAFYWLIKKYFQNAGVFRKNILCILIGTGFVGVFCTYFGILIPTFFGKNNLWFTPLFSIPMVIILTWFILLGDKKIYIK